MPKENFFMKNKSMLIIILLIIIVALVGYPYLPKGERSTINVQGSYEISVEPDLARVWAGVSILDDSANDAQTEVNKRINAMIKGLKEAGIREQDIETERLSLYEEKSWTEEGPKSEGWRATQILKVKTDNLDSIGSIVDVAVSNGANQINNIEFYLSEEKEAEHKNVAIAEATKNAKEKAKTIAASLDARLGKIVSVSESNFYYAPYRYNMEAAAGVDAVAESATVTPKDVNVQANINLVYEVR